jgi:sulfatase modifying factor 1
MGSRDSIGRFVCAALLACEAPVLAQAPPDYGIDFATIGSPGNRATIPSEVTNMPWLVTGSVGYEYRMSRTEVTSTQWLEFVQAYAPYWTGQPWDVSFTSLFIYPSAGGYSIEKGAENYPVEMSWRMAARYCNWLQNGKGTQQAAFESGAYDTSTFTQNPDESYNDQLTHSPGAKYWIPTRDEWAKAAFFDPNRYGPGQQGYWRFPNRSNDPPITGLPGTGGETNAGIIFPSDPYAMDVGSYPTVLSPWGLLDMSGGVSEWSEDYWFSAAGRYHFGARIRQNVWWDAIDFGLGIVGSPSEQLGGLRVASNIPTPLLWAPVLVAAACSRKRRVTPM